MTVTDDPHLPADLRDALDRVADALAAMFTGDPAPYAALWAPGEQPTLFGAWGPTEQGHEAVLPHVHLGRVAVLRRRPGAARGTGSSTGAATSPTPSGSRRSRSAWTAARRRR